MNVPFVIPQRDDDLLEESADNYCVGQLIKDEGEIAKAMKTFKRSVQQGEFEQILEVFDYFFPLIRSDDDIDPTLRIHLFHLLIDAFENLLATLQTYLADIANESSLSDEFVETNFRYSNSLLMIVYLLTGVGNQFENYANKKSRTAVAGAGGRGKRKAQADGGDDMVVRFWAIEDNRSRLTKVMYKLISMNVMVEGGENTCAVKFLWTPNKVDDSLKLCIMSSLCKLLENPETCKASGRAIIFNVFNILRYLCVYWDMHKVVARSLMELAPKLDYFQTSLANTFPFVDAIFSVQTDAELEPLVREMIAYGSRLDTEKESAKTESVSRAFSLFLTTTAEKSPETMHQNLAFVIPFLHCDPPILRNAVLSVFTEILQNCLIVEEELDETQKNQRNTLFQAMMDHIVDKSALVRTKVLHLWEKLASESAIPPIQFRVGLLAEARGRLKDESVMVRKAAISLLIALIKFNKFGANLHYDTFYTQYGDAKLRYNSLLQKDPSSSTYIFEDEAYGAVGDERMLIGEDRQNEFDKEAKGIRTEIETYLDAILFVTEMENSLRMALHCVRRGQISEMGEMMRFVCECYKFRIRDSMPALKRLFNLIWRKDTAAVDLVVDVAYAEALFSQNEITTVANKKTAQNLVEAMCGSTDEERVSLEQTVVQVFGKYGVSKVILAEFWKYCESEDPQMRLSATRLIVAVAKADRALIRPHIDKLFNLYRSKREEIRIEVLRVLTALATPPNKQAHIGLRQSGEEAPFRLSSTDKFIKLMSTFILNELNVLDAQQWVPHSRQVVNIIYSACSRPTNVISHLFDRIIEKCQECMNQLMDSSEETEKDKRVEFELTLSRMFYFVGEVVLKFLSYAESTFSAHIKDSLKKMPRLNFDQQGATPSRIGNDSMDKEDDEEGLGQGITEEEKVQMRLQKILDKDTFAQDTIIGRCLPLVMLILENRAMWSVVLQESVILCLAKFMLVNQRCCKIFLPSFFKFFDCASIRLRNNMIIMMTDLCFRFPNVFNEFNDQFITKIRDENSGVRYTCLLVSSHLLLNDQIKITADIADIAYCLIDDESHIKTLAHGFFCELAKKHNVLYNHIPAILDKLFSDPKMGEERVEEILTFLMQLVEKEPQKEKLVDKLVERFEQITPFRCIAQTLKAREERNEEQMQQQGTGRRGRPAKNK